ncbi:phage tail-collar fiber domain-containing protein [Desulfovibrio cuneatus]|uniref:phage tail-collar fiber domain-containing protein n=1 Tax=Desulfovibrio cuneatus TaxID=159728 RepID=UPI0003FFBCD3|nr:phage tail protein [Desulfovibrio cuneatus]
MAQEYYMLLTEAGLAAYARAGAGGPSVAYAFAAVGDGAGQPVQPAENWTKLAREVWRGEPILVDVDKDNPRIVVVEMYIPHAVGGFTVREVGLFDAAGTMLAVGNYPESYKPTVDNGAGVEMRGRFMVEHTNAEKTTLKIDPAIVMASREYVDKFAYVIIKAHNEAPDSHAPVQEACGKKYVPQIREIKTTAPLTGGGVLSKDLTLGFQPGPDNTYLASLGGKTEWRPASIPLSADVVIYVRKDGNNTNNGLKNTPAGAVATITRALVILGQYNGLGIYSATIVIGVGIYTESIVLGAHSSMGFTSLVFQGENADSTKITASRDDFTIYALAAMNVTFKNVTVAGDTTIAMVGAYYYASLSFVGCHFVGPSRICLRARSAEISLYGNTKISGAFTESVFSLAYAAVAILWDSFDVTGSAKCFVAISDFSVFTTCHTYLATFTGAFTGIRFFMGPASHIYSGGRGANFLPGNVAGTVPANQYCIYS